MFLHIHVIFQQPGNAAQVASFYNTLAEPNLESRSKVICLLVNCLAVNLFHSESRLACKDIS